MSKFIFLLLSWLPCFICFGIDKYRIVSGMILAVELVFSVIVGRKLKIRNDRIAKLCEISLVCSYFCVNYFGLWLVIAVNIHLHLSIIITSIISYCIQMYLVTFYAVNYLEKKDSIKRSSFITWSFIGPTAASLLIFFLIHLILKNTFENETVLLAGIFVYCLSLMISNITTYFVAYVIDCAFNKDEKILDRGKASNNINAFNDKILGKKRKKDITTVEHNYDFVMKADKGSSILYLIFIPWNIYCLYAAISQYYIFRDMTSYLMIIFLSMMLLFFADMVGDAFMEKIIVKNRTIIKKGFLAREQVVSIDDIVYVDHCFYTYKFIRKETYSLNLVDGTRIMICMDMQNSICLLRMIEKEKWMVI